MSNVISNGNCMFGTVFLTEMTSDTTHRTCRHYVFSLILRVALYFLYRVIRHQLNQILRACRHTFSARFTCVLIYHRNAIDNMYCIKRTCFDTASISQASIITCLSPSIGNKRHCRTVFHASIFIILLCLLTVSGTFHKSNLFHALLC